MGVMMGTEKWVARPWHSGTYRIRVRGKLDANWSDRLGGMSISLRSQRGEGTQTVLEGSLRDQSALAGVLNTLYELHLTILNVEALDPEQP
jgi:hypothetical protein